MAAETEHEVIKVCRSDGCDTGPGYWPVEAPKVVKKATKDAPEKVARTKPQMVRLDEKDPRFVDWRIKLGILLKQEMAARPTGKPPSRLSHGPTRRIANASGKRVSRGMWNFRGATGSMKGRSTSMSPDTR